MDTSHESRGKKHFVKTQLTEKSFDLSTVPEGRRFQHVERRCRLQNSAHAALIALALEIYCLVLQRCLHRSEFHMNDSLDHWQCDRAPSARNPYVIADCLGRDGRSGASRPRLPTCHRAAFPVLFARNPDDCDCDGNDMSAFL